MLLQIAQTDKQVHDVYDAPMITSGKFKFALAVSHILNVTIRVLYNIVTRFSSLLNCNVT